MSASLAASIQRFDEAVERLVAPHRGRNIPHAVAAVVSNLADYGYVWTAIALVKGRRPGPARQRAVVALGVAGCSSLAVNTAVKRLVRRGRPVREPDRLRFSLRDPGQPSGNGSGRPADERGPFRTLPVRTPTSSSFPSGHTLAAACTAVTLADSASERTVFLAFAAAVGVSRLQLGDHHASDVLGGLGIGVCLGAAGRRLVPVLAGALQPVLSVVTRWPG